MSLYKYNPATNYIKYVAIDYDITIPEISEERLSLPCLTSTSIMCNGHITSKYYILLFDEGDGIGLIIIYIHLINIKQQCGRMK